MNLVSGLPRLPSEAATTISLINSWIDPSTLLAPRVSTVVIHDSPTEAALRPRGGRPMYLQTEPETIVPNRTFLLTNARRFHSILTFDAEVLRRCPNAVRYVVGGCWVHPEDRARGPPDDKQFALSTLVGTKRWGEGHVFRGLLYTRQREIESIPYTFYRSTRTGSIPELTHNPLFVWDSKFELFRTYQYSIAIENSKQENYFTEKLIDCFVTKTIPIYWGCPNIGDFFRVDGMILLDTSTFEEFKAKIDTLTPETYAAKREAIEENYRRAHQYMSVTDNINRALKSIPDY